MTSYDQSFFSTFIESSERSADVLLPMVLELTKANSILDVGCGLGVWLDVAKRHGVRRVHGLDSGSVEEGARRLDPSEFTHCDLARLGVDGPRTDADFDLALCLEVAEHLPASSAPGLVDFLCDRSPIVLFGAAIPFQGGTGHVNEQWPEYWAGLFNARGYRTFDAIRPRYWADDRVSWWYRQNLLLYVSERADGLKGVAPLVGAPQAMVQPDLYLRHADPSRHPVADAFALFVDSLRSAAVRRLRRG